MHPRWLVLALVSVLCTFLHCALQIFLFNPPLFLGRNNVFLAIGSGVLCCHKYWKMFLCIFFVIFSGIGRRYLKRLLWLKLVYLLPLILRVMIAVSLTFFVYDFPFLLKCFANWEGLSFKSSEENMPKISIYWYCSNIVVFFHVFVYRKFGLCLLVKLWFFLNLWMSLLLY